MKICIAKNMVEFVSSVKTFNGEYLERRCSVETKRVIFNKPSAFLLPDLTISTQFHNTSSSIYINKNHNYIYEKTMMISINGWYEQNNNTAFYKDSNAKQQNSSISRQLLSKKMIRHQL